MTLDILLVSLSLLPLLWFVRLGWKMRVSYQWEKEFHARQLKLLLEEQNRGLGRLLKAMHEYEDIRVKEIVNGDTNIAAPV